MLSDVGQPFAMLGFQPRLSACASSSAAAAVMIPAPLQQPGRSLAVGLWSPCTTCSTLNRSNRVDSHNKCKCGCATTRQPASCQPARHCRLPPARACYSKSPGQGHGRLARLPCSAGRSTSARVRRSAAPTTTPVQSRADWELCGLVQLGGAAAAAAAARSRSAVARPPGSSPCPCQPNAHCPPASTPQRLLSQHHRPLLHRHHRRQLAPPLRVQRGDGLHHAGLAGGDLHAVGVAVVHQRDRHGGS